MAGKAGGVVAGRLCDDRSGSGADDVGRLTQGMCRGLAGRDVSAAVLFDVLQAHTHPVLPTDPHLHLLLHRPRRH